MDTATLASTQLQAATHGISSVTFERALALLGSGVGVEATAAACGVSASRISQLLSDDSFKNAVSELRFKELQKHNKQDSEYDSIESLLTEKFKSSIPLLMRPMEILKGLQVINAQKRRGASAPEAMHDKQTVVTINLPSAVINNFTSIQTVTNIHNQVVKVGDTDLTTMQSGTLLNNHKALQEATLKAAVKELTSVQEPPSPPAKKKFDPTDV